MADHKLTAFETEAMGRTYAQPAADQPKVWSDEARQAALAARRAHKKPKEGDKTRNGVVTHSKDPHRVNPTQLQRERVLDSFVHDAHSRVDTVITDIKNNAANVSRWNSPSTRQAMQLSADAKRLGEELASRTRQAAAHYNASSSHLQAAKNAQAKNEHRLRQLHMQASVAHEDYARALLKRDEHDKLMKKPLRTAGTGKSFYATGDAVALVAKPEQRLLVVDAGIDAKAGPWVAVREDRLGVPGMSQKRFVVKPGELKAWSDEARQAALAARQRNKKPLDEARRANTLKPGEVSHNDKIREQRGKYPLQSSSPVSKRAIQLSRQALQDAADIGENSRATMASHQTAADAHQQAANAHFPGSAVQKYHEAMGKLHRQEQLRIYASIHKGGK